MIYLIYEWAYKQLDSFFIDTVDTIVGNDGWVDFELWFEDEWWAKIF